MKEKMTSVLSILLCVVLVAAALCVGIGTGWQGERDALAASDEVLGALRERAMDGVNLAVVAARHVGESDASVAALRNAYQALQQDKLSPDQILSADAELSRAAADLLKRLPEMQSVKSSARDSAYVVSFTRSLSGEGSAAASFSKAQKAFNDRMASSLTGRLAMLLGVKPFAMEVNDP